MEILATILSLIAVLTGLASLWFTYQQWQKIKTKIGMISDSGKATEILPAWYTERMMDDDWYFGLVTTGGNSIAISKITAISDDGKWMNVELLTQDEVPDDNEFIAAVGDDRRSASIQINTIVMAYEIITS
ncbi:MAG: hypothetical protein ABW176_05835 [Candidatus Thiodiazotropha endolucinida]